MLDESKFPPDKKTYLKCHVEKSEFSVFNENKYQHLFICLFEYDTLPIVGFEWCINHVHLEFQRVMSDFHFEAMKIGKTPFLLADRYE